MGILIRLLGALLSLTGLLMLVLGITLWVRYGGGAAFPDRSGTPRLPASVLEVVADLPTPPGNIAVSASGRVFASLHPEANPYDKIVEIIKGQPQPWPNDAFQTGDGEPRYFRSVLSLRIDRQNRLWTLDNGGHGIEPGRLLAFDLKTGEVVHEYVLANSEFASFGVDRRNSGKFVFVVKWFYLNVFGGIPNQGFVIIRSVEFELDSLFPLFGRNGIPSPSLPKGKGVLVLCYILTFFWFHDYFLSVVSPLFYSLPLGIIFFQWCRLRTR